ncbi:Uncharacterized membrane protein YhhN [Salinihabitans flavidus]|uniref:Uncharacterized membrane protein YhhN n=1 Tax=Salinihabitans flavidus TaxID=569882 RepID=A0A1H8LBP7_9RHOB|nr:lysoplasmalogenase family protein [Salinihabitans flavidus]SEO02565.1 Uncharacterized membrane protein YhhN [Salinihabitans flavidus]
MTVVQEIMLRQSILYGGIAVGLVAALIYGAFFCHRGASRAKTAVKAVPLVAFAVGAAANFAAPVVIGGLVLSAVGDVALSRAGRRAFLVALVAFAAAHLAYIVRFAGIGGIEGLGAAPLVAGVVLLIAASTEMWLAPYTGALKWPVRIYVVLIAAMALLALGIEGRGLAIWGALAFFASDLILAVRMFRMSQASRWRRPASVALWALYVLGQAGILVGAGFARPLFQL